MKFIFPFLFTFYNIYSSGNPDVEKLMKTRDIRFKYATVDDFMPKIEQVITFNFRLLSLYCLL